MRTTEQTALRLSTVRSLLPTGPGSSATFTIRLADARRSRLRASWINHIEHCPHSGRFEGAVESSAPVAAACRSVVQDGRPSSTERPTKGEKHVA
jgi:hypothetical protein